MTQTDLPEDSKFNRVDLWSTIVNDEKYYSYEEEDDESFYMEHQTELQNDKAKPNGVDVPTTVFIDAEQTREWQETFNIDEEIRYTKDG